MTSSDGRKGEISLVCLTSCRETGKKRTMPAARSYVEDNRQRDSTGIKGIIVQIMPFAGQGPPNVRSIWYCKIDVMQ